MTNVAGTGVAAMPATTAATPAAAGTPSSTATPQNLMSQVNAQLAKLGSMGVNTSALGINTAALNAAVNGSQSASTTAPSASATSTAATGGGIDGAAMLKAAAQKVYDQAFVGGGPSNNGNIVVIGGISDQMAGAFGGLMSSAGATGGPVTGGGPSADGNTINIGGADPQLSQALSGLTNASGSTGTPAAGSGGLSAQATQALTNASNTLADITTQGGTVGQTDDNDDPDDATDGAAKAATNSASGGGGSTKKSTATGTKKSSSSAKTSNSSGKIDAFRQKVIDIARSQIGVKEIGDNGGAAIAKYRRAVIGGTGDANTAWCAYFTSWVFDTAGKGLDGKGDGLCANLGDWAKKVGRYLPASATPTPGDAILLKGVGSNWTDHIGIVESVDPDGTIHTIEGNADNQVKRNTYKPGSSLLRGFIKAE